MTFDLFADAPADVPRTEALAPGAVVLRGFARADEDALLAALEGVLAAEAYPVQRRDARGELIAGAHDSRSRRSNPSLRSTPQR